MPSVAAQPLLAVADLPAACTFYEELLGLRDDHGGPEYRRLIDPDGTLVLQLHDRAAGHHHGRLRDPEVPPGDGVLLWFAVSDFDGAAARSTALGAEVVTDVHVNPNAHQRELWLRDRDGYLVVVSERALD